MFVGDDGKDNRLIVSDGGLIANSFGTIGDSFADSSNNLAVVTGPGSVWSNAFELRVGNVGPASRLVVSNGGTVFASNAVFVGFDPASLRNRLVVDGGTLRTVNASASGTLDVRRGTNVLNAGLVEVDRLLVTNVAGRFELNGGTLSTRSTVVNNGQPFLVGNGMSATTFNLVGNGGHSFAAQLVVGTNAALTGNGNISGVLLLAGGGTFAPGTSIGNINLSAPPALLGTVVMELTKNGAVLDYDQVQVSGPLTYGGTLIVTNLGPTALAAGDRFKLFSAGSYTGSFASLTLPPLDPELAWTNKLSVDGSIEVTTLSVQTLPASAVGPDQATLNGVANPGGAAATAWFEWGLTTNYGTLTPPRALGSGMADTNFSQSLTGLVVGSTYHFRAVASNNLVARFGTNQSFTTQAEAGFALSFNGTSNYLEAPHNNALNFHPLTVTAWVKTTQATGEVGIVNKYVAGSSNGWQIYLLNGNVRAWYFRDGANYVSDGAQGLDGGPIANGVWHHVALVVDAASGRLYLDGALMDLLPWTGTPGSCTTTQVLSLGRYPGGAGEFFRGVLDEVSIWTGARTGAEIQAFMDRGLAGGGSGIPGEYGLFVYYRLPEGAGTYSNDNSPAAGNSFAELPAGGTWVPGVMLRPALVTKLPTAVSTVSARLNSVVNPGHTHTTTWFEWGPTTNYGNVTPAQALGSGADNTNVSQVISGLTDGALYHFRGVASNLLGASYGDNQSFVTTGTNMSTPRAEHTATLLPNGKVLVAGGNDENNDTVSAVELYDPATGTWAATSPMSAVRRGHSATLLPDGKVLVAGGLGVDFLPTLFSVEIYDPATGNWTPAASMGTNRWGHTAALLRNGKVLVAGGFRGNNSADTMAELYDPTSGTWSETGAMLTLRTAHTMTLLPNGKVLVAGGRDFTAAPLSSAELYDPVSGMWSLTGSMTTNRNLHTATLLPSGKVLVVGGLNRTNFLRSAELYDPLLGTWTATGSMLNSRIQHTATLLPNGRVLASGVGFGAPSLYNPLTGTWTDVAGPDPGASATATLLANGKVLIAGGTDGAPTAKVELFDYANGSWAVTAPMTHGRDGHTATLLPDARVLVAGFTNAEIYNPVSGTWASAAALNTPRSSHRATLLPSGKVLVSGGFINSIGGLASAELYSPGSGTWTNTGSLNTLRGSHTATLLPNGKVLVAGGMTNSFFAPLVLSSAELYDPALQTWTNTGAMTTNRVGHTATLLLNGRVLVAGGLRDPSFGTSFASAELYDPVAGTWTPTGSMITNRTGHSAALLPNGKVLVAGGSASAFFQGHASAELYDPVTGTWQAIDSLITGRQNATLTLLPNGKVLVAAGYNLFLGGYLASAELFDPATGHWTATAALGAARISHTSTLLPNGRVLVAGGYFGSGITNRAELYDVGLGFSNSWRPQITAVASPLTLGGSLIITGAQFRGLSEGSGGNSPQNSPSDHPVVELRSLESQASAILLAANWSTNSFASLPISGVPPGWAMVTVFVNGIPSTGAILSISGPSPTPPHLFAAGILANGSFQFGFANAPNGNFTVLATTNVALPLTDWTVLGAVTEISPGQFQFSDPQATNNLQRYYHVRSP
jgi:T5SS/PEP-CTERM-associated repeat protein